MFLKNKDAESFQVCPAKLKSERGRKKHRTISGEAQSPKVYEASANFAEKTIVAYQKSIPGEDIEDTDTADMFYLYKIIIPNKQLPNSLRQWRLYNPPNSDTAAFENGECPIIVQRNPISENVKKDLAPDTRVRLPQKYFLGLMNDVRSCGFGKLKVMRKLTCKPKSSELLGLREE